MARKNLLKGFKSPRGITLEPGENTNYYGKFIAYPFERGYGTTVANSLRRALLSSIQGYAVTAVRFTSYDAEGTPRVLSSEYESIPGVVEETIDIINNLKQLCLEVPDEVEQKTIMLSFSKEQALSDKEQVVSGANFSIEGIRVENADFHVMTLMNDAHFDMEVQIEFGRGFVLAEDREINDEIGVIRIDAIFSPIKKVKYDIKSTRVGRRSDYDKMELEVWTDGTVSPVDALGEAAKITKDHFSVFINFNESEIEDSRNMLDDLNRQKLLDTSIEELELSVRAGNCLKTADINTIGELAQCTEDQLSQTRNFGKKSLMEIKEKLAQLDLALRSSEGE